MPNIRAAIDRRGGAFVMVGYSLGRRHGQVPVYKGETDQLRSRHEQNFIFVARL
jgi:hypothetical protein